MLFTIVDTSVPRPSFRGLLFVGSDSEMTEELKETRHSMQYVTVLSRAEFPILRVVETLKESVCFAQVYSEEYVELLRAQGFSFYRVRDMDTGREV